VPFVVVDTSVSLPATLSSSGLARKFWVLLAFGAASYRAEHSQRELEALELEAADVGGAVGGQTSLQRLAIQAQRARAAMEELLPIGTPSDWVAVGGVDLFSEYERKVEVVAAKIGLDPAPDAAVARRQVEAICVAAEPLIDPGEVPPLTPDPDDDLIVWTALTSGADLLVSDDRHIVSADSDGAQLYEHGDDSVLAVTFGHLVDTHLAGIEWSEIDGRVLPHLYGTGVLDE
jgi:predicted nucleic acid-binding protein